VRRLRVGVIGLGVGAEHAAAFAAHPACEVAVLCDTQAERRAALGARYPGARLTADADEVLKDPALDVVAIASYDDAHAGQALAALQAGKHAFVEKPLARTLEELRAIKESWARGASRALASNLVLRAAPLYAWLRAAREAGRLGRLYAFDGDYLYGRLPKITEGWRKDVADYSVVQGGGIHLVDLMLWVTGERPVAVTAAGSRIATAGTAFRYDDYVAATFRFASGLVGRITANFGCVHRHQHVVRVFGTEATVLHDDAGPRLHESRDPAAAPRPLAFAPLPASKGALVPAFVDGILAGRDGRAETQHDLDVVSACVAADRALRAGGPVEVEYV
jgi:predicted dehydrogenase